MDEDIDDSCTICLEPLSHTKEQQLELTSGSSNNKSSELYVAELSGCQHIYHHMCIQEWSERTNSCPTCRAKFNKLTIREHLEGPVVNQIEVDERAQPANGPEPEDSTPAEINGIPYEDLIIFETEGSYGDCVICQSGERGHELLICDGCDRTFHVTCLGLGDVPLDEFYCPTCELDSEYSGERTTLRSLGNRITASTRGNRRRGRGGRRRASDRNLQNNAILRADSRPIFNRRPGIRNAVRPRPASLVTTVGRPDRPPLYSQPTLVPEEIEAWNMLEIALNQDQGRTQDHASSVPCDDASPFNGGVSATAPQDSHLLSSPKPNPGFSTSVHVPSISHPVNTASTSNTSSNTDSPISQVGEVSTPSKKLKRPSRANRPNTPAIKSTSNAIQTQSSPTLDNSPLHLSSSVSTSSDKAPATSTMHSLLSHIRAAPKPQQQLVATSVQTQTSPKPNAAIFYSPSPPLIINGSQAESSASSSGSPSPTPVSAGSVDLSFDKKKIVQSMVKDILRPIYRAGNIDKDQYTEVCRRTSRALYEVVKQQEDHDSTAFSDDSEGLVSRQTVYDYVKSELKQTSPVSSTRL